MNVEIPNWNSKRDFRESLRGNIYILMVSHMHMSEIRDLVEVGPLPSTVTKDAKEA